MALGLERSRALGVTLRKNPAPGTSQVLQFNYMNYKELVAIFWLIFVVVWVVTVLNVKKDQDRSVRNLGKRALVIFVVLLFIKAANFHSFGLLAMISNSFTAFVGCILTGVGIGVAIWARLYLGRNWGLPMSVKKDPELVTTGPYAYVRNPIYSGVLLAMFGSALVSGSAWILFFIISASYFIYSAKKEEGIMLKEFPTAYPDYRKQTKMLIPRVF